MAKFKRRLREPQIGETWTWFNVGGGRCRMRIERFEGEGRERRAFGSGSQRGILASTLATGCSAARLELDVNGEPAPRDDSRRGLVYKNNTDATESRRAGEMVRQFVPKGVIVPRICETRAANLLARGISREKVAEMFRVTVKVIERWRKRVLEAEEDAKNMRDAG